MSDSNENGRPPEVFRDVLFAQCWEDPQIDRAAFRLSPDDVVFSITSGGCNSLTFLLDNPAKVIALDLNPHQNHVLDLKMAAFRGLSWEEMLELMGARPSARRREHYEKIRGHLGAESWAFWDAEPGKIARGILHCGRYEGYLRLIRTWLCRLMGRSLIHEFFRRESPAARRRLYRRSWDRPMWRVLTRLLLSRATMSLALDPEFFAELDEDLSFGKHFRRRAERALTELPIRENYFLAYILLGRFLSEDRLPVYLRRESFEPIRNRLDRVEMVTARCERFFETLPPRSISRFNFTNIFEWMPAKDFELLLRDTVRVARDGAILTYRNLLVPRSRPLSLADRIRPLPELSAELHARDLSFTYRSYVVEEVTP